MKVNVKGTEVPAVNVDGTGYADLFAVMEAFGIPVRMPYQIGNPRIPIRRFAEALSQPHQFILEENTFYIAAQPLPPLPTAPVGADREPWLPVTAPICGGPGDRRANLYERIIAQFRVETNPRYRPTPQATFCNIFVWDVTRAMGAEIPHWVIGKGEISSVNVGRELDANAVVDWLRRWGPDHGWRPCKDVTEAMANLGRPVVAAWLNPRGIGHVAMVRPGAPDSARGVPIAQTGKRNFDDGYLWDGFIQGTAVEFYVHN